MKTTMKTNTVNNESITRIKELLKLKVDAMIKHQMKLQGFETAPRVLTSISNIMYSLIDKANHPVLLKDIDTEISKYY